MNSARGAQALEFVQEPLRRTPRPPSHNMGGLSDGSMELGFGTGHVV